MFTNTEQQDTTEKLDRSQVQAHVSKDRAILWRLKDMCVRATRTNNGFLRSESRQENVSDIEWLSTSILHDLRNPLGAIYAAAEMLMDLDPGQTQVQRLATNIYRAAGRMRGLLADLNSVALGNRSTAEMCDICEVIFAASNAASAATENHRVQMLVEVPERIELPLIRSRIERVFFNLITNALEAMPGGGEVRIRVTRNCDYVLVAIEDTGPGISHEIRDRLFEPFVTAGKQNGLGLGLTFARQSVVDHGGDMWVERASGARFVIRLPLNGGESS